MFRYVVFLFLFLLFLLGSYFWIMRVSLIQNYIAKELKVDVDIGDVSFGPNEVIIENLKIDNPQQTTISFAAKIDKMILHIRPWSLLKNKLQLDRVEIYHPVFGIEYYNENGSRNNWAALLKGLSENHKKLISIDLLTLYEIEFEAFDYSGEKISIWPIPYIEISSLGENKGISLSAIVTLVFKTIFSKMQSEHSLKELDSNIEAKK